MTPSRRTILITGGTTGIGRELVKLYSADGWRVITCARSVDALESLERQLPDVTAIPCDLADAEERRALLHHVEETTHSLDGLINNAGVQRSYTYTSGCRHAADVQLEVAVNLIAPVELGHLFAPMLSRRDGFIANITSGLAYIPKGRSPLYAGTKAGLSLYTRSVRFQAPRVRFVEVVMPLVNTQLAAGRGREKIEPHDAARQARDGIAKGRDTVWVGKARLIPLLNRVLPNTVARLMNRADDTVGRTRFRSSRN